MPPAATASGTILPLVMPSRYSSRARLLRASTILAWLVKRRSEDEVERIKAEAIQLFGDADGRLDLEALSNAPRTAREETEMLLSRQSGDDDL